MNDANDAKVPNMLIGEPTDRCMTGVKAKRKISLVNPHLIVTTPLNQLSGVPSENQLAHVYRSRFLQD